MCTKYCKTLHFSVSWISTNGYTYKIGHVIPISANLMPNFGVIVDIIVNGVDDVYIVLKKLETLFFDNHLHSYNVSFILPPEYITLKTTNFYDSHPLSLYRSPYNNTDLLVPLKYYLIENV